MHDRENRHKKYSVLVTTTQLDSQGDEKKTNVKNLPLQFFLLHSMHVL